MKIGYRTVSFSDRSIEDALDVIAEAGYNAVELCLENPDLNPETLATERVRELRQRCESNGLSIAAVSYHGIEDQLEVRRQRTYKAIDLLPEFGAKVFVVASRREEPARLPAQWEEAIDLYRELATLCQQKDCRLAVEPQPGLVIRSAEDLVKMLRQCNHPNLSANLDLAHAACTADDLSWAIFQLGERLVHVHVADVVNREHQHLLPGEGDVDFDEVHDILDRIQYDGPLVIDIPRPEGDAEAVCREALSAFRGAWNGVA